MDDNNISYLVKKSLPSRNSYYKGTYTSDFILRAPELRINLNGDRDDFISFIVNSLRNYDSHDKVGHWLAIIIFFNISQNKLSLRYFDSFARSHRKYKEISKFIDNIRTQCHKHNVIMKTDTLSFPIQPYFSKLCGVYCSYCVIKCYNNKNQKLNKIFENFSGNLKRNDNKMISFLRDKWSLKGCHNIPINSNIKLALHQIKNVPPFCPKKTLNLRKCYKKCQCHNCCLSKKL